jgi:thermitase
MDVAAPGVDIFSTFPNHPYAIGKSSNYDYGSGTSMSTPHVAGLAGLVWATGLCTDNACVRNRIESTADRIAGTGTYWIHGRINACKAVGGNCN